MLETAREVSERIDDVARRITNRDIDLRGVVRITVPEALVGMLAQSFERFASTFPELQVELIVDDSLLRVTRRETDIALRFTNKPPDHLIGRHLATTATAVYASKGYVLSARKLDELAVQRWVGWEERFASIPAARWMRTHIPKEHVAFRINSTIVLQHALRSGIGVGLLATFIGEADPELVRISEVFDELNMDLWLLTHPDLRKSARVRGCMDHLQQAVQMKPELFELPHNDALDGIVKKS